VHFQNKPISYDFEKYAVVMLSLVNVEQMFGRFDVTLQFDHMQPLFNRLVTVQY
jgi:hypothetical protein